MKSQLTRLAGACLALCTLAVACGDGGDAPAEQTTDSFSRAHGHMRPVRPCSLALGQCIMTSCSHELSSLRRSPPFGFWWFARFEHVKSCMRDHCSAICSSHGAGGAGGSAGASSGSAGGGQAGSAGTGSICAASADACQACLCAPCEAQVQTCRDDSACASVLRCGLSAKCTGVDCYFANDGSRGPCADVIDAAGGPASAAVGKALDVFRCTENVRPSCTACAP